MSSPELSLVLPLYNEEDNVVKVIPPIAEVLDKGGVDYELVLVDNGSRDKTAELIHGLANKNSRIKTTKVDVNQGYGWGIICGLKQAGGHYLGFMGSDGQIEAEDVLKVYRCLLDNNVEFAKVKRVTRHDGLDRKLNSLIYNFLFSIMFNVKSLDVNGTPKIISRSLYEKCDLCSKDWFLDAEVMIKAKLLGITAKEVDVDFLPRAGGSSNVRLSTRLEFLKNMFNYCCGGSLRQWKKSRL